MWKRVAIVMFVALAARSGALAAPCQTGCAGKSALQCAIDGLGAHQWCEFGTPPSHADMSTCAAGNPHITTESDTAVWDPVRNQVKFIGSPHGGSDKILVYDEATNDWSGTNSINYPPTNTCSGSTSGCTNSPNVSGVEGCTPSHGYDHNAVDPATGEWFVQGFDSEFVNRWSGSGTSAASATWTELPSNDCLNVVTTAIVYFPDRTAGAGLFRVCRGTTSRVNFWTRSSNSWSTIHTGDAADCTINGEQDIYNWAEYDPKNKVVWFGGQGTGAGCTYRADGTFDQEVQAPFRMGPKESLVAADPVGGGFIVRNECGAHEWYHYDPIGETWARITWSMPPVYDDTATGGLCGALDNIEATIAEYNAIMYITHGGGDIGNPRVYLYRHTTSTPTVPPNAPSGLQPN